MRSLLGHIGTAEERHAISAGDLRDLRRFQTKAGLTNAEQTDGEVAPADRDALLPVETAQAFGHDCTVLIDHHEAWLFGLERFGSR